MRRRLSLVNVGVRAAMELGVVAGAAVWGWHVAPGRAMGVVLAVVAPAAAFGFWGAVDFRFAGAHAEPLRLGQELTVSALAAAAFYASGLPALAWTQVALTVIHHAGTYALGERLLERQAA